MKKIALLLLVMFVVVSAAMAQSFAGFGTSGPSALSSVDGLYAGADFIVGDFENASESMALVPYVGYSQEVMENLDVYGEIALPISFDEGDFDVFATIGVTYTLAIDLGDLSFGAEIPISLFGSTVDPFDLIGLDLIVGLDAGDFGGAITIINLIEPSDFFESIDISGFYKMDAFTFGLVLGIPISNSDYGFTITPEVVYDFSEQLDFYATIPIGGIGGKKDMSFGITIGARYSF